jgi:hypothetical protein
MLRLISGSPTPNNSGLWLFAARVCVLDVKKHVVTLPNKTRIRRDPSQFLRRPLLNNRHLQTQFSNAHFHHYKCLTDLQATVKSARADYREMRVLRETSPTLAVLHCTIHNIVGVLCLAHTKPKMCDNAGSTECAPFEGFNVVCPLMGNCIGFLKSLLT